MSDLIERLRANDSLPADMEFLVEEAADEIERLQARVETLEGVIDAALDEDFISNGWLQDTLAATEQGESDENIK